MVRGFCRRCSRPVGGFRNPTPWQCNRCRYLYCERCCGKRRVGWIHKKPVCPDCGIELAESGSVLRPGFAL